jgi:hypothetical protein
MNHANRSIAVGQIACDHLGGGQGQGKSRCLIMRIAMVDDHMPPGPAKGLGYRSADAPGTASDKDCWKHYGAQAQASGFGNGDF